MDVSKDMNSSKTITGMSVSSTGVANITSLPLGDPLCNNDTCFAFKTAHNASQAQISWASQFEYGHWTTYFYLIFIALFGLIYWFRRLSSISGDVAYPAKRTTIFQKVKAVWRSIMYRRLGIGMSLGIATLIGLSILFAAVLTFAQKPYYRLHRGFGSPPLAVRTGLMAVALIPIIVALSGKYNAVTLITGISYERFNVFHRYVAYICLALSVVHTIPFIVAPLRDGGVAALQKQFRKPSGHGGHYRGFEYTGIPPLAVLTFLSTFSIPWIRHRFYETFAHSHILASIIFLGLLFWHTSKEGDSWSYLWATVAIWLFSLLGRLLIKLKTPRGAQATLEDLDGEGEMLKITIPAVRGMTWGVGSHVFLRFPTVAPLDNHPFTVASLCGGTCVSSESGKTSRMPLVFLVRPRNGITGRLMKIARRQERHSPTLKVLVEGSYGGLDGGLERSFEQVVLVAGGSGISAMLPLLTSLSRRIGERGSVLKDIRLIWTVRNRNALSWMADELKAAIEGAPEGAVRIDYYVTAGVSKFESSIDEIDDLEIGKGEFEDDKFLQGLDQDNGTGGAISGRPELAKLIPEMLKFERIFIAGCGPTDMSRDLSNAVAACQSKVLSGEIQEVALHTETFGW